VNGVNIVINNGLTSYFAIWSDKGTDTGFLLTYDSTFVYNNLIQSGYETHSPSNQANALIIKNIPLTSINDIQALVYYNRTGFASIRVIGLVIELYNSTIDPDLNEVLATTNEITTASETYRFDFPSISTYTAFVDVISITNIVNDTFALTEEANVISFPTEITGDLVVVGDLTANNVIVGSVNLINEINATAKLASGLFIQTFIGNQSITGDLEVSALLTASEYAVTTPIPTFSANLTSKFYVDSQVDLKQNLILDGGLNITKQTDYKRH
jgi:hypothetical protein